MHVVSERWRFGLFLSLLTALLWGLLPIALSGLLNYLDVATITGLRFLFAAVFLGGYLAYKKRLSWVSVFKSKRVIGLFLVSLIGLLANYILYMQGLAFTTPESAQVMIQLAPMLLLLGGLVVFKESFTKAQWLGLLIFIAGLLMFFNQRLDALLSMQGEYFLGCMLVVLAAITWAAYALAQKQLLKYMASEEIMVLIYIGGTIAFMPFASINPVLSLDSLGWFLLIFCGANTLVAYGAFAEALEHWQASRVSATLAITPLMTLLFMQLFNLIWPSFMPIEPLNTTSIVGALVLVLGSAITALSKRKQA